MLRTIGLMSGTSLDGVDAAWVETDGVAIGRIGPSLTLPYAPALRRDLRRLLDIAGEIGPEDAFLADCVARLTDRHAEAVAALREQVWAQLREETDLLGFHGQTILHRPVPARRGPNAEGGGAWRGGGGTWGGGDALGLSRRTGLSVAHDFRSADVA